ncbi:type I restriction-modification system subunit M/S [Lentzea sp. NEAU-D7]|uniref:N-6 DNA methylase n=1 Tax=Lentzea sp. NEAU-D7 TaxID=2994667 RepID=UPI00224B4B7E|nr:type I restriction-modification system subunit M/S [Lentzea sp. NEAU-D7]MCX2950012.1 N-6 DNA methylase [Lentzea sp. NEAU-D7]
MNKNGLPLSEIARLAGVRVSAASNWRTRHADFPVPDVVAGQELFDAAEMAHWLSQRKIPRNGLQPDEAPGSTYGDRFTRNSGMSTAVAADDPSVREEMHSTLRSLTNVLRGQLDLMSSVQFAMALLHLRKTEPVHWSELVVAPPWAMRDWLQSAFSWGPNSDLFSNTHDTLNEHALVAAVRLVSELPVDVDFGEAFDVLLEHLNRDLGKSGGHFTPPTVVRTMMKILAIGEGESIYDPSCGSGELLTAAGKTGAAGLSLFGQALSDQSYRISVLSLLLHDLEGQVHRAGPQLLRGSFPGKQFDVVVTNPPFSGTLPAEAEYDSWPFGIPSSKRTNLAYLQIAVAKLKPGGRAALLAPNGSLFTSGQDEQVRHRMVESGLVAGIVALPPGLFSSTGIPVSLWLLRKPGIHEHPTASVLFIDASGIGTQRTRGPRHLREEDIERLVHASRGWQRGEKVPAQDGFSYTARLEEIRDQNYNLQPTRYVRKPVAPWERSSSEHFIEIRTRWRHLDDLGERIAAERRDLDARLESLVELAAEDRQEVKLGDVCEIQVGLGHIVRERGVHTPGWIPLLLPRNIKRGYLSHDELDTLDPQTVRTSGGQWERYLLRAGDVVAARSGTLGRHGLVSEGEAGWILGPSCLRIRPGSGVSPEYLVHYLNSPEMHAWITTQVATSTAIPHINSKRMELLPLSLPSLGVQREIATTMELLAKQIERYEEAVKSSGTLRDNVFSTLLSD